jgi:hypothetical protein
MSLYGILDAAKAKSGIFGVDSIDVISYYGLSERYL